MTTQQGGDGPAAAGILLDRTRFFNRMIRALTGTLEATVGLGDAEAFVTSVGSELGDTISADYARVLGEAPRDAEALAEMLVDFEARIGGAFRVVSVGADEIVLANTACPFAEGAHNRPSLCMMTTTVFGRIAAGAAGHARVSIDEAIESAEDERKEQLLNDLSRLSREQKDMGAGWESFRPAIFRRSRTNQTDEPTR